MGTHTQSLDQETVLGDQDLFSIAYACEFLRFHGIKATPEILSETLSLIAQKVAG